jgi:hypothetical protein
VSPDDAAYASNWWRILLIDFGIGMGIMAMGGVAVMAWGPVGLLLVALGVFYVVQVVRRALRWRRLRDARDPGR